METSEVKVSPSVKKAAKLLDKVIPGWHNRVNVDKLDMGDCATCMLGQTFGLDAEMGIAKELYPEEWQKAALKVVKEHMAYNYPVPFTGTPKEYLEQHPEDIDGYAIGRRFFRARAWRKKVPVHLEEACSGNAENCEWIAEIADRRALDSSKSASKKPTKRGRK